MGIRWIKKVKKKEVQKQTKDRVEQGKNEYKKKEHIRRDSKEYNEEGRQICRRWIKKVKKKEVQKQRTN